MAANILTKAGIECLMLNAGPEPDFERNRVTKAVYELPFHGFGQPGRLPHETPVARAHGLRCPLAGVSRWQFHRGPVRAREPDNGQGR
jgi:hypothetical protein